MRINLRSFCRYVKNNGLGKMNRKKIYLWGGDYLEWKYVKDALYAVNIQVEGVIDCDDEEKALSLELSAICKENISLWDDLFVIVMTEKEIGDYLEKTGMRYYQNYIVVDKKEKILDTVDYYCDIDGNLIDSHTYIRDCSITIQGYESKLIVGKNVKFGKNCKIDMGYNSTIVIGDNCNFGDNTEIKIWEEALLKIGHDCVFGKNSFISSGKQIVVGQNSHFGFNTFLADGCKGKITIGNGCLVSNYVKFRPDSGHSIFDVELNSDLNELHLNEIVIEDNVWIGLDVIVLGDAVIHSGSMIGAGSLVKKDYPGNCVLAGNPARIIRENILWDENPNKRWELAQ